MAEYIEFKTKKQNHCYIKESAHTDTYNRLQDNR
jgi:hypothetical protein